MKILRSPKRDTAFTLVELIVVVLIVALLAAIAVPIFLNIQNGAYKAVIRSDVNRTTRTSQIALTRDVPLDSLIANASKYINKSNQQAGEKIEICHSNQAGADPTSDFAVVGSLAKSRGSKLDFTYAYDSVLKKFLYSSTVAASCVIPADARTDSDPSSTSTSTSTSSTTPTTSCTVANDSDISIADKPSQILLNFGSLYSSDKLLTEDTASRKVSAAQLAFSTQVSSWYKSFVAAHASQSVDSAYITALDQSILAQGWGYGGDHAGSPSTDDSGNPAYYVFISKDNLYTEYYLYPDVSKYISLEADFNSSIGPVDVTGAQAYSAPAILDNSGTLTTGFYHVYFTGGEDDFNLLWVDYAVNACDTTGNVPVGDNTPSDTPTDTPSDTPTTTTTTTPPADTPVVTTCSVQDNPAATVVDPTVSDVTKGSSDYYDWTDNTGVNGAVVKQNEIYSSPTLATKTANDAYKAKKAQLLKAFIAWYNEPNAQLGVDGVGAVTMGPDAGAIASVGDTATWDGNDVLAGEGGQVQESVHGAEGHARYYDVNIDYGTSTERRVIDYSQDTDADNTLAAEGYHVYGYPVFDYVVITWYPTGDPVEIVMIMHDKKYSAGDGTVQGGLASQDYFAYAIGSASNAYAQVQDSSYVSTTRTSRALTGSFLYSGYRYDQTTGDVIAGYYGNYLNTAANGYGSTFDGWTDGTMTCETTGGGGGISIN